MSYEQWKAKLEGAEARIAELEAEIEIGKLFLEASNERANELEAWQKVAANILDEYLENEAFSDVVASMVRDLLQKAKEPSDE
jgi:hypothetical protein